MRSHKGGYIALKELGIFQRKQHQARAGRNPQTGASIQIPAKPIVHFKVAKRFADKVAGK